MTCEYTCSSVVSASETRTEPFSPDFISLRSLLKSDACDIFDGTFVYLLGEYGRGRERMRRWSWAAAEAWLPRRETSSRQRLMGRIQEHSVALGIVSRLAVGRHRMARARDVRDIIWYEFSPADDSLGGQDDRWRSRPSITGFHNGLRLRPNLT